MILLVGESGSGKSLLEKELERKGFNRIISYTTRPMRDGEVEGVSYHFLSRDEFERLIKEDFFAEHVEYNGNYYGTSVDSCVDDAVIVVEPDGLRQLQEKPDLKTISFYLKADEVVRYQRMTVNRKDPIDHALDRVKKDKVIFKGIEKEVDFVIDANRTIDEVVIDVLKEVY